MFAQRVAGLVLVLLLVGSIVHAQDKLPIRINSIIVSGDEDTCPLDDQLEEARSATERNIHYVIEREISQGIYHNPVSSCAELPHYYPSGYYYIQTSDAPLRVYCDMDRTCSCDGTRAWMRVANLDMTDPNQQCPSEFRLVERTTSPQRLCGRHLQGCVSTTFLVHGVEYSRVCGRVIGYQDNWPDAFYDYFHDTTRTVDDQYVDGVSLTHGSSPRNHIWTFAGAWNEARSDDYTCPCTNTDTAYTGVVPPFIGQDYFCETAAINDEEGGFFVDDPLWDGQGCGADSTCCNHPLYFCKQLPQPTTDDIELRLCGGDGINNEDTPIEIMELYVQ